jgi:pyroglutamyl-peptidase
MRTLLLIGFGPFPGAPVNPTADLVRRLAERRHPAFALVRRVAHVFETSYAHVDRDLPQLLACNRPDAVLMFGLAQRSRQLRIETLAHNALTRKWPDVTGNLPDAAMIAPSGPPTLALRSPARRLVSAAQATGVPVARSRNAGRYLCNYLCWRVSAAANRQDRPHITAFVHVPPVSRPELPRARRDGAVTFAELLGAGEAIALALLGFDAMRH